MPTFDEILADLAALGDGAPTDKLSAFQHHERHRLLAAALAASSGTFAAAADLTPNGQIVPPASTVALFSTAAWSMAGRAVGAKFTVEQKGTYQYANFLIGTLSGNIQVCVCPLDGLDYSAPVMDSGLVDMTTLTTGAQHMDLGATVLDPGDYVIWIMVDNTTATVAHQSGFSSLIAAMRHSLDKTGVGAGITTSGVASYGGRAIAVSLDLA